MLKSLQKRRSSGLGTSGLKILKDRTLGWATGSGLQGGNKTNAGGTGMPGDTRRIGTGGSGDEALALVEMFCICSSLDRALTQKVLRKFRKHCDGVISAEVRELWRRAEGVQDAGCLEAGVLSVLPDKTRVRVCRQLYSPLVERSDFFRALGRAVDAPVLAGFHDRLVQAFSREPLGPGRYLSVSPRGAVYVVRRGAVRIFQKGVCVATLTRGSVFEICALSDLFVTLHGAAQSPATPQQLTPPLRQRRRRQQQQQHGVVDHQSRTQSLSFEGNKGEEPLAFVLDELCDDGAAPGTGLHDTGDAASASSLSDAEDDERQQQQQQEMLLLHLQQAQALHRQQTPSPLRGGRMRVPSADGATEAASEALSRPLTDEEDEEGEGGEEEQEQEEEDLALALSAERRLLRRPSSGLGGALGSARTAVSTSPVAVFRTGQGQPAAKRTLGNGFGLLNRRRSQDEHAASGSPLRNGSLSGGSRASGLGLGQASPSTGASAIGSASANASAGASPGARASDSMDPHSANSAPGPTPSRASGLGLASEREVQLFPWSQVNIRAVDNDEAALLEDVEAPVYGYGCELGVLSSDNLRALAEDFAGVLRNLEVLQVSVELQIEREAEAAKRRQEQARRRHEAEHKAAVNRELERACVDGCVLRANEAVMAGAAVGDPLDSSGATALHLAAVFGHAELVALLLRLGADVRSADREGRTPLHVCCLVPQWNPMAAQRIVGQLVPDDASLYSRDAWGNTPLHLAASAGCVAMLEVLTARVARGGADATAAMLTVQNKDGLMPLDLCANQECKRILKPKTALNGNTR
jgi:hypothetical protein